MYGSEKQNFKENKMKIYTANSKKKKKKKIKKKKKKNF